MSPSPPDPRAQPTRHQHLTSFHSVLDFLIGHRVTVVDSQSLQEAPVGRYLDTEFYEAKVLSAGSDYLLLIRECQHQPTHGREEKIRQFLPIDRIKRVVLMSEERLIHI